MQKNKEKVEEIPIEEFSDVSQNFREEFLNKFGKKEGNSSDKNKDDVPSN